MVQTCYICKWRADREPRRSFHKFPFDEAEKQKWLDIIGKSEVSLGKRTSVCSAHFEKSCFRYGLGNGRELLRQGSLPTLQLTRPPEVDPYEELCNLHQVRMEIKDIEIKIEPMEPGDDGDSTSQALDRPHQEEKTKTDETLSNNTSEKGKPKTFTKSFTSTKARKEFKQKPVKSKNLGVSNRKEILKKQALVRMLVERLRRDHVRLKNYIQSLEEKQNKGKCRRRRKPTFITMDT